MIKGIGLDMTKISRIKKACEKDSFRKRIFTEEEQNLCDKFPAKYAGNFAVKEAVAKMLGSGFRGFLPADIEVLRDELGKPYVKLYGKAEERASLLKISSIFVSITDEDDYVSAVAIGEGDL